MDYYDRKRKAGKDLEAWLKNPKREAWQVFARITLVKYGLGNVQMSKMLAQEYPEIHIVNDKPRKKSVTQ